MSIWFRRERKAPPFCGNKWPAVGDRVYFPPAGGQHRLDIPFKPTFVLFPFKTHYFRHGAR